MNECLIGFTGFVGSNLLRSHQFNHLFNSKNFRELKGKHFSLVVCSALPAEKWKINQNPSNDQKNIEELQEILSHVTCDKFVLISTVDVYPSPNGKDESLSCRDLENHSYGKNRLNFEKFVQEKFPETLIVRLPGLFGVGLKKNVIFDLMNDNCLDMINPQSSFQYYDLSNLWEDICKAQKAGLKMVNLVSEPIQTKEIIERFFPGKEVGSNQSKMAQYDLRTLHSKTYGGPQGYIRNKEMILEQLKKFLKGNRA